MSSLISSSYCSQNPSLSNFLHSSPLPKIRCSTATALSPLNGHSLRFNPLLVRSIDGISSCRLIWQPRCLEKRRQRMGTVCYAGPFSAQTLQWVSAVSSAVLMLVKGTAIHKSFLVPLFALQAPASVISWIKGDYGTWAAFLALLVRLFYFIPGELDLPFLTFLFVIVAPYQAMNLRESQAGAIISVAIAGYLAFQHFSRAGSLRKAFDQVSVIATLAIICIACVSCLFLF